MKKKLLLWIFTIVSTIGFVIWRTCLIGNYVDPENGFFNHGTQLHRYIFAAGVAVVVILIFVMVFSDKNYPSTPRRTSVTIATLNIVYAILALVYAMTRLSKQDIWNKVYIIALFVLAIFLFYYALKMLMKSKISQYSTLIPLLVFIYTLAFSFISSFGLIKSSKINLHILSLIACVVFFESYARYISMIRFKFARKLFSAFGMIAPFLLLVSSVPDLIAPYIFDGFKLSSVPSDGLFLISTAVYIFVYVVVSFSKKLLYHAFSEEYAEHTNDFI